MRNARDNLKPLKKKKCVTCKEEFQPFNSLQKVCGIGCSIKHVRAKQEAAEKRKAKEIKADTRKRKKALKTRTDELNEAQTACNAYIRWRDEGCISCGTEKPDIQYCAGHFKTRGGHPELRFHPLNIHKQCNYRCNSQLSGNISAYRPRLIEKIGLSAVEWLEGPHKPQNWSIEDIQGIKQYYKDLLKYESSH